jgi:hypothetical protein
MKIEETNKMSYSCFEKKARLATIASLSALRFRPEGENDDDGRPEDAGRD